MDNDAIKMSAQPNDIILLVHVQYIKATVTSDVSKVQSIDETLTA